MIEMTHDSANTFSGYSVPLFVYPNPNSNISKTLLIGPALGLSASYYQPFALALAERGYHCVIMEQRGHGKSAVRPSHQNNWGFGEWLSEDIPTTIAWISQRFPDTDIVPIGHSISGHLFSCYAGLHPNVFNQIILVACVSPWMKAYNGERGTQLQLLYYTLPLVQTILGYYPGKAYGFGGTEARGMMQSWRALAKENRYVANGIEQDLDNSLSHFQGQLLSLRMEHDNLASEKSYEAVLKKFSAAAIDRIIIDSATAGFNIDHFRWARKPEATIKVIDEWLKKNRSQNQESAK